MRRWTGMVGRVAAGAFILTVPPVLGDGDGQQQRSPWAQDATEAPREGVVEGDTLRPDASRGRAWMLTTLRQHRLPTLLPAWLKGTGPVIAEGLWAQDSVGARGTLFMRVGTVVEGVWREMPYRFEREDRDTWRGVRVGPAGVWPDTLMAHRRDHP